MAWVQWDDVKGFQGIVRALPDSLLGRGQAHLNLLGYRELVVREPENFIRRFQGLLGSSEFNLLPDGRVEQSFPKADFSVAAVRKELGRQVREAAQRELAKTDWYVIRGMEKNESAPQDILDFRDRIRDHVDWVIDDIAKKTPRELIDYDWMFPQTPEQRLINGVPTVLMDTPPPAPGELAALVEVPDEVATGEGLNHDAEGVFGNADINLVEPPPPPPTAPDRPVPPPTTDGPVPLYQESAEHRVALDAEGFPLVTVYAPNVEDTGPLPAND